MARPLSVFLSVVSLAAACAVGGFTPRTHAQGGAQPPTPVLTDAARTMRLERWREVTGELRSIRRSTLAAEQEGLVLAIDVDAGDRVEKGQVLARLDDRTARLQVDRAEAVVKLQEATIAEREATLGRAQRDLQRLEEAASRSGVAPLELDQRKTEVAEWESRLQQAKADLTEARAELALAKKRLDDMTISAPFAGLVAAKQTEVGQWLSMGDTIVDLVQLTPIDAWLDVPESVVWRLQQRLADDGSSKPTAGVRLIGLPTGGDAGFAVERRGPVIAVLPEADPLSRLFPVRVRLENADNMLRPGMSIVGVVPTGEAGEYLTISRDAVRRSETGPYVLFDAGGTAMMAPVEILFPATDAGAPDRLAVRSSVLKDGMPVLVEGNERVYPGRPIQGTPRQSVATPTTSEQGL